MIYELSEAELRQRRLPVHFNLEQTAGILCIELFDRAYIDSICRLGLPVLLVDGPCDTATSPMNCDRVSMENLSSIMALVGRVIAGGARRIGFVGDPDHCASFRMRWFGFQRALSDAGLSLDKELCILDGDESPYDDAAWLSARLLQMPRLPDALICVNDFIAIRVMSALKQLGVSIPEQLMLTGFDGTAQSAVVEPSLTTVQIPGMELGRVAAGMLLTRFANPDCPSLNVYAKTAPIWRESTNRK